MTVIADGVAPLVVGTVLALGALSLVLAPLVSAEDEMVKPPVSRKSKSDSSHGETSPAVLALREIEFDRATGKLSDDDYAELKARYTGIALAEMRAAEEENQLKQGVIGEVAAGSIDPVEEAIIRAKVNQRVCRVCGPRTEPDAVYCSGCGGYLPGVCKTCSAPVELPGARFCSECGKSLAA